MGGAAETTAALTAGRQSGIFDNARDEPLAMVFGSNNNRPQQLTCELLQWLLSELSTYRSLNSQNLGLGDLLGPLLIICTIAACRFRDSDK
jgi:hypothetical protein